MPGSDSEEEIDDVEFDNDAEDDLEQELFDAMGGGAEEATDGDAVCYSSRSCIVYGTADGLAIGIPRRGFRRRRRRRRRG